MAPSHSKNLATGFAPVIVMTEFVDPYLDPDTGILRNKVGASTQSELDSREAELTAFAAVELSARPIKVTGDLRQLMTIHGRLFQDVYSWAGKLRQVDMRKGNELDGELGSEFFMPVSRLESGAGFAFQELADDKLLTGLDQDAFVNKLAHHFDQVNYLHPTRDGNGRTQRIFWSQISAQAGYELDWRKTSGQEVNQASRDAMEKQDLDGLRMMFTAIATPQTGGVAPGQRRLKELGRRFPELRDVKLNPYGLGEDATQTPDADGSYQP